MNTVIYNHLKNEVNNRIREYNKDFKMTLSSSSDNSCAITYSCTYEGVEFSIGFEYASNQIKISSFIGESHSSETSFEITDFVKFMVFMPQEDLKRRIEFSFSKW